MSELGRQKQRELEREEKDGHRETYISEVYVFILCCRVETSEIGRQKLREREGEEEKDREKRT